MNEENKNVKRIQELLQQDAENIQIPESLKPEAVKEKLKTEKMRKTIPFYRYAQLAAAIAVIVIVGGVGGYIGYTLGVEKNDTSDISYESSPANSEETDNRLEKKRQIGDLYILASNYDEIYNAVPVYEKETFSKLFDKTTGTSDDMVMEYAMEKEFSQTNVQENGVDESDFIKTDGSYIYVADNNDIAIIDIRDEQMKEIAKIYPEIGGGDEVKEIYLEGSRLYAIAECYETELKQKERKKYSYETVCNTVLFTYDIVNREHPKQIGKVTVEGNYHTSRRIDGHIYIFTTRNLAGIQKDDIENVIPYVQGKKIAADCIYYREQSTNETIMVSVEEENPNEIKDSMMVLDNNAKIYMGKESIYLYSSNYMEGNNLTEIAKFTYEDGYMQAVAANSVRGNIEDTFAISEKDGYLRILTTEWTNDRVNQLYILDQNLYLKGEIDDIARGESIYAARYMGDIAYFITYRNMDPLFVADLSDVSKPKLLGSVEISGFSDYIQGYGENKILGIGYETDEKSNREGVKLVIFDVSDPMNPVIQGTKILPKMDYVSGTYYYKRILADAQKNLIGFLGETYSKEFPYDYIVYRWNEEKNCFENLLEESLKDNYYNEEKIRGLYVGDTFYLVEENRITSYDMKEGFIKKDIFKEGETE